MNLDQVLKDINSKFNFRKIAEISGIKFELGPLTLDEEQRVSSIETGSDPMLYYTETQKYLLSFAIKKINGEEIPDIIKVIENEKEITKEKSIYIREFVTKLPTKVIDKLYDIYIDLKEQSEATIDKEVKFDWYKTPEQREKERYDKENNIESEKFEKENEQEVKLRKIEETEEETIQQE